jgi:hypothetical protein
MSYLRTNYRVTGKYFNDTGWADIYKQVTIIDSFVGGSFYVAASKVLASNGFPASGFFTYIYDAQVQVLGVHYPVGSASTTDGQPTASAGAIYANAFYSNQNVVVQARVYQPANVTSYSVGEVCTINFPAAGSSLAFMVDLLILSLPSVNS